MGRGDFSEDVESNWMNEQEMKSCLAPVCRCCDCQGKKCLIDHPGHSHKFPYQTPRLGPARLPTEEEYKEAARMITESLKKEKEKDGKDSSI